jgi:protein TonB
VQDAVVIGAQPPRVFDQAAVRAVRKWRYNPKTENGVAVARTGQQVRLRFQIPRGR